MLLMPELGLYVVCDGMGGHVGGQVASQSAVRTIGEVVRGGQKAAQDQDLLATAIKQANTAILTHARQDPSLHNMGTTVVGIRQEANNIHLCHVGDSRIYRLAFRTQELAQVTRDHSLANLYQDKPELAVAFGPPNDHVIVRAVGLREDVEVDHQIKALEAGDIYLLCCDGLTDMVDDWILREVMVDALHTEDLEDACDALIRAALNNGGVDNITAILARVVGSEAST